MPIPIHTKYEIHQPLEVVGDAVIYNETRRSCCDSQTENITGQASGNTHPADMRGFSIKSCIWPWKLQLFSEPSKSKLILSGRRLKLFQVTHHILLGCSFQGLDHIKPVPAAQALNILIANITVSLRRKAPTMQSTVGRHI